MKHRLLQQAIATALPRDDEAALAAEWPTGDSADHLSPSLLHLLRVLPGLLARESPLPPDAAALLFSGPPFDQLEDLLPPLAALVSAQLREWALDLARMAHPSANPSFLHRHIASLPRDLAALRERHSAAEETLAAARAGTLTAVVDQLQQETYTLARYIRLLEAKHGLVARNLQLRSQDACLQAQQVELDAAAAASDLQKALYPPEAVAALRNYAAQLETAQASMAERIRQLETELARYGVGIDGGEGREQIMRELASQHRQLTKQIQDAESDVRRLQRR